MLSQFLRFGLVGALATLVHMLIGAILIHSGWSALAANPISFLIAFVVSFMGHYGFSFSDQSCDVATSLKRFALVAVGGFAVNEGILAEDQNGFDDVTAAPDGINVPRWVCNNP